jgi:hypothetical protein
MTDKRPTQLVVFSYNFWRIDADLEAVSGYSEVRGQVQAAIEKLYNWLERETPTVVQPLQPSLDDPLEETVWLETPGLRIDSLADRRKSGLADCRSVGGTVTLTIGTLLNAPKDDETIATLSPAHWNQKTTLPLIGSQLMWGATFDADLIEASPEAMEPFSNAAFGKLGASMWETWQIAVSGGQIRMASVRTAPDQARTILVLSDASQSSQVAASVLAQRLLPAAARHRARALDVYYNHYRGTPDQRFERKALEQRLRLNSDLLASFKLPLQETDALDKSVSKLTGVLAAYGEGYAALQSHRQSIRVDQENFETLLDRHRIPDAGWFGEVEREIQVAARQMEADAGYADIQFRRGQSLMTAMNTRAEIIRASIEQEENSLSSRRNLLLTSIGLVLGLGQIIDRETGKEFVNWLMVRTGVGTGDDGLGLFLTRAGLVVVLSAMLFGAGWLLWRAVSNSQSSASPKAD